MITDVEVGVMRCSPSVHDKGQVHWNRFIALLEVEQRGDNYMKPLKKNALFFSTCLFALLFFSSPASADIDAAVTDFKTCVEKHVGDERTKKNPKVDNLLSVCRKEYQALTKVLPNGAKDQIAHFIRDDMQNLLGT